MVGWPQSALYTLLKEITPRATGMNNKIADADEMLPLCQTLQRQLSPHILLVFATAHEMDLVFTLIL